MTTAARPDELRWRPRRASGDGVEESLIVRLRPEEGWLSLALVLVLAFTMAWSIADARWILGRDDLTRFLVYVAPLAALWGFFSARIGMSRWAAHTLGAAIGAFVLIETIGSLLPDATPGLGGWFQATADSVTNAYLDLTWRHQLTTTQYGHFCLVLGILVWGTAQAAAYDVFGHRRAVNGVLLMAVVLVANMSLTIQDQFGALVLFSAASLALLLQTHAADERSSWMRHRIWRARDTVSPHLRGGMAFASIAVVGSLFLTSVASSAPLANAWTDSTGNFRDFATWISQYLPASNGGSRIPPSAGFGTSSTIGTRFDAPSTVVFTVQVPDVSASYHWRVASYDVFVPGANGRSTWGWSAGARDQQIGAGQALEAGTDDALATGAPGRTEQRFSINVQDHTLNQLVVANEPASVNVPVTRKLVGPANAQHVALATTGANSYSVTVWVPDYVSANGLTAWKMRQAGTGYPSGLREMYTQGAGDVGLDAKQLLDEIKATAPAGQPYNNAYDLASAIQLYLQDPQNKHGFTYTTDITDLVNNRCSNLDTVDCFARFRTGFCQQYATTMTMLMRLAGYPARYVQGYLPGALDPHAPIQRVTLQQQHAWVEVYFPTYGWVPFDPTKQVGQPTTPQPGVAASPTPSHSLNTPGAPARRTIPPQGPEDGGAGPIATNPDNTTTLLLVIGVPALVLLIVLLLLWRQRRRPLESPDAVYQRIARMASFFGYRPQPTQTVYEYTGMLATVVPRAREQLDVVATAKVESTYGQRKLGVDRLRALDRARQKLQLALLRLALRRPRLPRRGRRRTRR